jgi:hypothetical protein
MLTPLAVTGQLDRPELDPARDIRERVQQTVIWRSAWPPTAAEAGGR